VAYLRSRREARAAGVADLARHAGPGRVGLSVGQRLRRGTAEQ
jgi:hypothetical protein